MLLDCNKYIINMEDEQGRRQHATLCDTIHSTFMDIESEHDPALTKISILRSVSNLDNPVHNLTGSPYLRQKF